MIAADRLNGIRTFVQAADAGSFTLAAERLGLSRSAVGKSIARLEERLAVRLFHRTTRSLSLTNEGLLLYESAQRALAELEFAESALASRRHVPSGRLRIDLPVLFGRKCVLPVLLDLANRYAELKLDVTFNNRHVDLIEEGIDLVIRIGDLENLAGLTARRLGAQNMVICGAASYLRVHGYPECPEDLAAHDCITYNYGGRANPWLLRDTDGKTQPRAVVGRLRFGDGGAIAEATRAGHGLAQLPTWLVAAYLKSGELVAVLPESSGDGFPIHALWPQTRHIAPKVRVLVDDLVKRFLPVPPWEID